MTIITLADLEQRPWLLDHADELTYLLFTQRGVISMPQAMRFMSRGAVRHRCDAGHWRQVHRAVCVAHNGPITDEQRLWIALLAAGATARLAGRCALALHGLKAFPCRHIDVLLPAGRREDDPPSGVRVHRTRLWEDADLAMVGRLPTTTPARAVVDAASWARSDREARTVIAMAFQHRMVDLAGIRAVLRRNPRARRRRLTWLTAADAAGGSEALAELDILRLLRRAGLPLPTRQAVRTDSTGRRRYLDLYYEEWSLHIEIDGAHHLDPQQAWLDADRQNCLWIKGDRILRFPSWVVRDLPDQVIQRIREALIAAGYSG